MFKKLLLSGIVCAGLLGAGWNAQAHHNEEVHMKDCVQEYNTNVECKKDCNEQCDELCNTNVECEKECDELCYDNVECEKECNELCYDNLKCEQDCERQGNEFCHGNARGHSDGCGRHHSRCR